jgi:Holliday junction resolvase RusA-like endonuclease
MRGKLLWETGFVEGRPSTWANPPHEQVWREILTKTFRELPKLEGDAFSVEADFHIGRDRIATVKRNDVDNFAKVVLDEMMKGKLSDDTLIYDLRATKHPSNGKEGARIRVWLWSPESRQDTPR